MVLSLDILFGFKSIALYGSFAEAGNVWEDFESADIFDLKRSAGFGIRLNMPMLGILGYDASYGFDSAYDNGEPNGWEYHLIWNAV